MQPEGSGLFKVYSPRGNLFLFGEPKEEAEKKSQIISCESLSGDGENKSLQQPTEHKFTVSSCSGLEVGPV